MFFFYIDESGNPDLHHVPLLEGETPLFVLTSICVHETNWRTLGHDFVLLKQRFFKNEIGSNVPLTIEFKGSDLSRPGNRNNRRNHAYIDSILKLCDGYNIPFFSIIIRKDYINPADKKSIYTMSLQYLVERFQAFLDENDDNGIMIIDSRVHSIDLQVAQSHLSYIFGNVNGRQCNRIIEAPMFTDSRLTAGLQVVDVVGSCIYTNYYYRTCRFIQGALDYTYMRKYRLYLDNREFHSNFRHNGYFKRGFRFIQHGSS
jgi:hypothetical protein